MLFHLVLSMKVLKNTLSSMKLNTGEDITEKINGKY